MTDQLPFVNNAAIEGCETGGVSVGFLTIEDDCKWRSEQTALSRAGRFGLWTC